MNDDTMTGTIKTILPEKGWGFVRGTDYREYFFHHSGTHDFTGLRVGTAVRFVPTEGPKGLRAEQVEAIL
jgi:cold shock CspA family protein